MIVPLPSLSRARKASTKSSYLPFFEDFEICWNMGRNVSKSTSLEVSSVTHIHNREKQELVWRNLFS